VLRWPWHRATHVQTVIAVFLSTHKIAKCKESTQKQTRAFPPASRPHNAGFCRRSWPVGGRPGPARRRSGGGPPTHPRRPSRCQARRRSAAGAPNTSASTQPGPGGQCGGQGGCPSPPPGPPPPPPGPGCVDADVLGAPPPTAALTPGPGCVDADVLGIPLTHPRSTHAVRHQTHLIGPQDR